MNDCKDLLHIYPAARVQESCLTPWRKAHSHSELLLLKKLPIEGISLKATYGNFSRYALLCSPLLNPLHLLTILEIRPKARADREREFSRPIQSKQNKTSPTTDSIPPVSSLHNSLPVLTLRASIIKLLLLERSPPPPRFVVQSIRKTFLRRVALHRT
jgi:hypothetical protein